MTLLLVGSILLIAGSAVALLMGWVNADETYIWTSIGATIAAAVLLGIAFFRSRSQATAVAAAEPASRGAPIDPEILADREERSNQKYARQTARGEATDDEEKGSAETQVLAPDATAPTEGATGAAATAGAAATTGAAGTSATTGTEPDQTATTVGPPAGGVDEGTVVAVPKTKKFHRPDCRFASAKDTTTMDRDAAEARGFEPCGVCKP